MGLPIRTVHWEFREINRKGARDTTNERQKKNIQLIISLIMKNCDSRQISKGTLKPKTFTAEHLTNGINEHLRTKKKQHQQQQNETVPRRKTTTRTKFQHDKNREKSLNKNYRPEQKPKKHTHSKNEAKEIHDTQLSLCICINF